MTIDKASQLKQNVYFAAQLLQNSIISSKSEREHENNSQHQSN